MQLKKSKITPSQISIASCPYDGCKGSVLCYSGNDGLIKPLNSRNRAVPHAMSSDTKKEKLVDALITRETETKPDRIRYIDSVKVSDQSWVENELVKSAVCLEYTDPDDKQRHRVSRRVSSNSTDTVVLDKPILVRSLTQLPAKVTIKCLKGKERVLPEHTIVCPVCSRLFEV